MERGITKPEAEPRSEEVQELMATIPGWIIRHGITLFFGILAALFFLSWMISYPDIIPGRITLTSSKPPVKIIARTSGRLNLYVHDQQEVKSGEVLGVLENPASNEDVKELAVALQKLKTEGQKENPDLPVSLSNDWQLGELQVSYNALVSGIDDYRTYLRLNQFETQKKALEKRLAYYRQLNEQLIGQSEIYQKGLKLAQKKLNVDSSLNREKVISDFDLDNTRNIYLESELALQVADSRITSNLIEIATLEEQLTRLQIDHSEKIIGYKQFIRDQIKALESELSIWKKKYLVESPIHGKVSFFNYVSSNQYVRENDEILTIVPDELSYYGEVIMPVTRSGKVMEGQQVNIKFDGYPFEEYGMVKGRIESISLVPRDNVYRIRMSLVDGLNTTYKKTLDYRPEMTGNAEIITEDLNLFERIFNQFRKLINKRY